MASKILKSVGYKRYATAILNMLIPVLAGIPGLSAIVPYLSYAAGGIGGLGLIHAASTQEPTIPDVPPKAIVNATNLSAVLAVLIAGCQSIPSAQKYLPILEALAGLFGTAAVTKGIVTSKIV